MVTEEPTKLLYKRVLLKISGEALMGQREFGLAGCGNFDILLVFASRDCLVIEFKFVAQVAKFEGHTLAFYFDHRQHLNGLFTQIEFIETDVL